MSSFVAEGGRAQVVAADYGRVLVVLVLGPTRIKDTFFRVSRNSPSNNPPVPDLTLGQPYITVIASRRRHERLITYCAHILDAAAAVHRLISLDIVLKLEG